MPLPDLLSIARQPFPEGSGYEMKKVMLLMLGCAVQSDRKEEFVGRIKALEVSLQHSIVEQIQKVTSGAECVVSVSALELDPRDAATTTVLGQLERVVKERDAYAHTVHELCQETESDASSHASSSESNRKLPEALQPLHTGASVELLELKARLRKALNELDGCGELVSELREELTGKEEELGRVQAERIQLLREARAAKDLQDELDALQHQLLKADRLETDNTKLRERLSELEFYRSRVEELRSENHILLETRGVLQEQLESWKGRAGASTEVELRCLEAQKKIHALQSELRCERDKAGELVDDLAKAQRESLSARQRLQEVEAEAGRAASTPRASLGTLAEQLNDSTQSQLRELELENQKLKARLESVSDGGMVGTTELIASLQSENRALVAQLDSAKDEQSKAGLELASVETSAARHKAKEAEWTARETSLQKELEETAGEAIQLRAELESSSSALATAKAALAAQGGAAEAEAKAAALQRSLADAAQRLAQAEEDGARLAREKDTLRAQVRELETRLLEEEEQKISSETEHRGVERENRCLKRERQLLKEKLSAADEEFEAARSRLVDLERAAQRTEKLEALLEAAQSQIAEAETEKRSLSGSLEVEARRTARLGEDLVAEKLRVGELHTRLATLTGAMGLSEGASEEEVLGAWQGVQRELHGLRLKFSQGELSVQDLRDELSRTKDQVAALENLRHSAANQDQDSNQRMKELEHECRNAKEQVGIVQDKLRRASASLQTKDSEVTAARQELSDLKIQLASLAALQSENAKLQVSRRNGELEEELLRQDNAELQKQVSALDAANSSVRRDFERLEELQASTLKDYEALQALHASLAGDYEAAKAQLKDLRSASRHQRHHDSQLNESLSSLEAERKSAEEARRCLAEEREAREKDLRALALAQNEHSELRRSLDAAQCRAEVLGADAEAAAAGERRAKEAAASAALRATQIEGRAAQLQDSLDRKELDVVKLTHRVEMLSQLNSSLETESRALMRQLDTLIQQNQDLLHRALRDKDCFHQEEKELQEKMNALRRHKDKLEEKIMEQIKYADSTRRGRGDSPSFVKRAAKALMPRSSSRGKSKLSANGAVPNSSGEDNSSIQSGEDPSGGFLARNASTASFGAATNGGPRPPSNLSPRPLSAANTSNTNTHSHATNTPSGPNLGWGSVCSESLYASVRGRTSRASSIVETSQPYLIPPPPAANGGTSGHSCGTTESSLSSSSGPSPGRISWAGSERAVDCPSPRARPADCPSPRLRPVQGPRAPPLPTASGRPSSVISAGRPPAPPPRNAAVGGGGSLRSRPPPPYPSAGKPQRHSALMTSSLVASHSPSAARKPPPPYPGPGGSVRVPGDPYHNPSRMTRSLTADTFSEPGGLVSPRQAQSRGFTPQKTSTPKEDRSPATPSSGGLGALGESGILAPQNSLASGVQLRSKRFPTAASDSSLGSETPKRASLAQPRAVSLYENIDSLAPPPPSESAEDSSLNSTTTATLHDPDDDDALKPKKDSTIWYEYGCV